MILVDLRVCIVCVLACARARVCVNLFFSIIWKIKCLLTNSIFNNFVENVEKKFKFKKLGCKYLFVKLLLLLLLLFFLSFVLNIISIYILIFYFFVLCLSLCICQNTIINWSIVFFNCLEGRGQEFNFLLCDHPPPPMS